MTKTWMARAGERAVFIDDVLDEGLVSIGWAPLEPLGLRRLEETGNTIPGGVNLRSARTS